MKKDDENNWLDDAFDDAKNRELEQRGMATSSKAAVGIGCVVAVLLFVAALVAGAGLLGALASV